jgi:hypothetical protein
MSFKNKKLWQLFVISIMLILMVSFTLCTEDNDDDDDDDNGDNGDNGNGNGNGDNNTTDQKTIKFITVRHTPENPGPNEPVQFYVKIESDNPIMKVQVIVCNDDGICYQPVTMVETPPNSKEYVGTFPSQTGFQSGDKLTYHFTAKDSLETTEVSEDYEYTVA